MADYVYNICFSVNIRAILNQAQDWDKPDWNTSVGVMLLITKIDLICRWGIINFLFLNLNKFYCGCQN